MSQPLPPTPSRPQARPLLRLLTTLPGSYAFTWGLVALGLSGLNAAGVDFHEAETAMNLLAFVAFLAVFLWAFASPRRGRVWAVLLLGAAGMSGGAWALQRALLG